MEIMQHKCIARQSIIMAGVNASFEERRKIIIYLFLFSFNNRVFCIRSSSGRIKYRLSRSWSSRFCRFFNGLLWLTVPVCAPPCGRSFCTYPSVEHRYRQAGPVSTRKMCTTVQSTKTHFMSSFLGQPEIQLTQYISKFSKIRKNFSPSKPRFSSPD